MKIKIMGKIIFGTSIILLLFIIGVVLGIYGINYIKAKSDYVELRYDQIVKITELELMVTKLTLNYMDIIIDKDHGKVDDDILKFIEDFENELKADEVEIRKTVDTDAEKDSLNNTLNVIEKILKKGDEELIPAVINVSAEEVFDKFDDEFDILGDEAVKNLKIISSSISNEVIEAKKEIKNAQNLTNFIIIITLILGVIIGLFISIINARNIAEPVKIITEGANRFAVGDIELKGMDWNNIIKINTRTDELGDIGRAFAKLIDYQKEKVNVAKEIASGNLVQEISISSEDDQLGKALNEMIVSLNDLVGQVNQAVELVSSGSNQVAQASQSLSQGASEQASSLEEITSSITEISSQAKQNTDNAMQANSLAKQSMDNADKGNTQMNDLVSAMLQINKSADEIKRIVKVIDDIAFQTNLLALNANVEAARAGKYGKGFAVVAEEVRNLASRSAVSVKETTGMVEDAIKNIQNVNTLVETTAKQLKEITDSANKVADLVEEIATASKEQTEGLGQINSGLGQIDQVTQANTANAEESASASEELSGQAQQLKGLISRFKLKAQKLDNILPDNLNPHVLKLIQDELNKEKKKGTHIENLEKINKEKKDKLEKKIDIVQPKKVIKLDDDDFGKF